MPRAIHNPKHDPTPEPPWSHDGETPTEPAARDGDRSDAPPRLGEVLEQLVSRRRPLSPARLAQIESVARQRGLPALRWETCFLLPTPSRRRFPWSRGAGG